MCVLLCVKIPYFIANYTLFNKSEIVRNEVRSYDKQFYKYSDFGEIAVALSIQNLLRLDIY